MACDVTLPGSYILPELATNRIGGFMYRKFKVLRKLLSSSGKRKDEATCVSYTTDQFKSLLISLNDVSGMSGVRIYFASYLKDGSNTNNYIPVGDEDKMTLIFASTKKNELDDIDTGDYFIVNLSTNVADRVSFDFASRWVIAYQNIKMAKLEQIERVEDPSFQETKSTFYDKKSIIDWLEIIKCLVDQGISVDGIDICFGAYLTNERYAKKLSLVFSILSTDFPNSLINNEKISKKSIFRLLSNDYDTGTPCPPNKCNGFSLGN